MPSAGEAPLVKHRPTAGRTWLQVTVPAAPECVEAAAAACTDLGSPGVRLTDAGVVAYFADGRDEAGRDHLLARLQERLQAVRDAFGAAAVGPVRVELLDEEDWAEGWKRHWLPQPVGRRLMIVPSWLAGAERMPTGRIALHIDPGMAFGTGEHASTRLSLVLLEDALDRLLRGDGPARDGLRVLDVGTGSGILAVAAARLASALLPGRLAVHAYDQDELAVRVARENAALNGVAGVIEVAARDVLGSDGDPGLPAGVDLVLANILFGVLWEAAPRLVGALRPGGLIVLAGITADQREALAERYAGLGCVRVASISWQGWSGLLMRRAAPPAGAA